MYFPLYLFHCYLFKQDFSINSCYASNQPDLKFQIAAEEHPNYQKLIIKSLYQLLHDQNSRLIQLINLFDLNSRSAVPPFYFMNEF